MRTFVLSLTLGLVGLCLSAQPDARAGRTRTPKTRLKKPPAATPTLVKKTRVKSPANTHRNKSRLAQRTPKTTRTKSPKKPFVPKRRKNAPDTDGAMPGLSIAAGTLKATGKGAGKVLSKEGEFLVAEAMEIRDVALWNEVLRWSSTLELVINTVEPHLDDYENTNASQDKDDAAQQRFDVADARKAIAAIRRERPGTRPYRRAAKELARRLRRADLDRTALNAVLAALPANPPAFVQNRGMNPAPKNRWDSHLRELARLHEASMVPRQEFIDRNMGLFTDVLKRFEAPAGTEKADLNQESMLSFYKAINRFDRHKGFAFSTKATVWIQQGTRAAIRHFTANEGRVGKSVRDRPLPRLRSKSGDTREFDRADATQDVVRDAHRNSLSPAIDKLFVGLTEREARTVRLRYGLDDGADRTLEEVGALEGITKEAARQNISRGLRKLGENAVRLDMVEALTAAIRD